MVGVSSITGRRLILASMSGTTLAAARLFASLGRLTNCSAAATGFAETESAKQKHALATIFQHSQVADSCINVLHGRLPIGDLANSPLGITRHQTAA